MGTKIEERIGQGYIHFSAILEMVGHPKEHVESTFRDFIAQLKKNPKFELVNETINEVIPVEDSENLFSTFAELEVLAKHMGALYDFCFEAMPASIEILAPSELKLKPNQASASVNDLIGRIHQVDMQSKQLVQQINVYAQNLQIMVENAIVIYLATKPRPIEDISTVVGIAPPQLQSFLDSLLDKKRITKTDNVYGIAGAQIKKVMPNDNTKTAVTDDKQKTTAVDKPKKEEKSDEVIKLSKKKK